MDEEGEQSMIYVSRMFRCRDCGEEFEELFAKQFIAPHGYPPDYDVDGYYICPLCESLNLEEVRDDDEDD